MSDFCSRRKRVGDIKLTSLVIPKFNGLIQFQLIGVYLGIEAVERLQHNCEVAGAQVNRAPRRNRFSRIDLSLNVLQMLFSKALDWFTLFMGKLSK